MSTQLTASQQRDQEAAKNVWGMLEKMKPKIAAVLPQHITPERMAMIAFTAMRRTPKLLLCTPESIIGSLMTASILGLEPSGPLGHGALIPYGTECQFQPMYQGLLDLARRSGMVRDVQCRAVYKGDEYKYRFGLDPDITHVPMEGDGAADPDRECTHVYAIIRLTGGGIQWDQMSYAQAIAHAKRFSPAWNTRDYPGVFKPKSPWADHPIAMAMKTILKAVLKYCPKSPELAAAMQMDDSLDTGRTATMKRTPEGFFDVEFGGEPTPSDAASAPVADPKLSSTATALGINEARQGVILAFYKGDPTAALGFYAKLGEEVKRLNMPDTERDRLVGDWAPNPPALLEALGQRTTPVTGTTTTRKKKGDAPAPEHAATPPAPTAPAPTGALNF